MNVVQQVNTEFTSRHFISVASCETVIAGALQCHVLFICHKIVNSEGHRGKQVENKEWHFQEEAKGKYVRTRVYVTMKTTKINLFMLHFISNNYGDNHHLQTRDMLPRDQC